MLIPFACSQPKSGKEISIDFCSLKTTSVDSIANLIAIANEQISEKSITDDNCLIDIINDLKKSVSPKKFQAIEIIASRSDGALSEYLSDVAVYLLEYDGGNFLAFLNNKKQSAFLQLLIDGLSMKSAVENISENELKEKFVSRFTSNEQRELLNKIFDKVDASAVK